MSAVKLNGLYEEHAPVQAVYIGAHVYNPENTRSDDSHKKFMVLPGMILFTPKDNTGTVAKVTPHAGANLYPFGVAHDPLLDGKGAEQNPGTGDVISAIVGGCVTIYGVTDAVVGQTVYVKPEKSGLKYLNMDWYEPPTLSTTQGEGFVQLGSVVENYPEEDGVVRVLLDIEGYEKEADTGTEGDVAKCVNVAPQHPVYSQLATDEKGVVCEGMVVSSQDRSRTLDDEHYNLVSCNNDDGEYQGIITDTTPAEDQQHFVVGMIAGTASACFEKSNKPCKYQIGSKVGNGRVIARPDDYGEHYVLLRRGGIKRASMEELSAKMDDNTFELPKKRAKVMPQTQKKRRKAVAPTLSTTEATAAFGVNE